jgi:hypothetical protein
MQYVLTTITMPYLFSSILNYSYKCSTTSTVVEDAQEAELIQLPRKGLIQKTENPKN